MSDWDNHWRPDTGQADSVAGVLLCYPCSLLLRQAVAGMRRLLRYECDRAQVPRLVMCPACDSAVAAKYVDGRWLP